MRSKKIKAYKHRPLYVSVLLAVLSILGSMFLLYEVMTSLFIDTASAGSRSMSPGIEPGNHLIISKLPYGMTIPFTNIFINEIRQPGRGDVILLEAPYGEQRHIPIWDDASEFFQLHRINKIRSSFSPRSTILRRVIGVPGDRVYVNEGEAFVQIHGGGDFVHEFLLSEDQYRLTLPREDFSHPDSLNNYFTTSITVPENHLFILPDNRREAIGSPSWGSVDISYVRGRVVHVYNQKTESAKDDS